jgi:hypothetical protein
MSQPPTTDPPNSERRTPPIHPLIQLQDIIQRSYAIKQMVGEASPLFKAIVDAGAVCNRRLSYDDIAKLTLGDIIRVADASVAMGAAAVSAMYCPLPEVVAKAPRIQQES